MFRTVVAFDLETTGLEESAEILEIGAVRLVDGQVSERLSVLVRPSGPIPPAVERLTRISPKMIKDAPPVGQVLPRLLDFLGDAPLVGHNVDFDLGFVARNARALGLDFDRHRRAWDTVTLSQMLLPTLANHRLATVAQALGVPLESAHRACDDAEATARILHELVRLAAGLAPRSAPASWASWPGAPAAARRTGWGPWRNGSPPRAPCPPIRRRTGVCGTMCITASPPGTRPVMPGAPAGSVPEACWPARSRASSAAPSRSRWRRRWPRGFDTGASS